MFKNQDISLFLLFIIIASCTGGNKITETIPEVVEVKFDKQGHRGARGLMPENTIPAMKTALDLGVTTLEMDVVVTRDKQIVLSHEPFMNHEIATKPDGSLVTSAEERKLNIYRMEYSEVKRYDVGLRPHPRFARQQKLKAYKPLLTELIDSADVHARSTNRQLPFYNIEIKSLPATDNVYHPSPGEFANLLMSVLIDKKIVSRVIIQSFDFRAIQYVHEHYPNVKTALLIEPFDKRGFEQHIYLLGFKPDVYSPAQELVDKPLVRLCHENKMKIIPWTVNDKAKIQALIAMGVDGIITDYPDLFK